MFLSIIIPTRNRAKILFRALESILKQTFPASSFEVIVVDNGSTDNTRSVVESFLGKMLNIQYFYEERPGLHNGRHTGMINAQAENLVFVDDDVEAQPEWLCHIDQSFEDERNMLIGGKVLPKYESHPPEWIRQMWDKRQPAGNILGYLSLLDLGEKEKIIDPTLVFGCNFSVRKKIIEEAGGFHPDAMPRELIRLRGDGETHISRFVSKKGYQAIYNPKAVVFHWIPMKRMTKEYFYKRSFIQGISDSYTWIRENGIKNGLKKKKWFIRKFLNICTIDSFGRKLQLEYIRGIIYHCKEVKKDPELLNWINKTGYLHN